MQTVEGAEALGHIGLAAREAASALAEALKDPDERVREEAAEALQSVTGKAPPGGGYER
ncbi:MAG TPA: HEAT repeat domain-containing protein [Gemmataceae bacterium]|nr:HEAT repeat domain-containing protein [Gemmataceae bacterium]